MLFRSDALADVKAAYGDNVTVVAEANKALAALTQSAETAAANEQAARLFTLQIQMSGRPIADFIANMNQAAAAAASAAAADRAAAEATKNYVQQLTLGGLSPLSGAQKAAQAAIYYGANPTQQTANDYLTATQSAYGKIGRAHV